MRGKHTVLRNPGGRRPDAAGALCCLAAGLLLLPLEAAARSVTAVTPPFALDTGGQAQALLPLDAWPAAGLLGLAAAAWLLRRRPRAGLLALLAASTLLGTVPGGQAGAELDLLQATAAQKAGSQLVEIRFTLQGPSDARIRVDCELSRDGGRTWSVPARSLSGHVGQDVPPGTNRLVVWDAGADEPAALGGEYLARITAQTAPFVETRPIRTTHEDVEYFYALRASSPSSSPLTYRLESGPEGMTVDAETGDLLWRPAVPGSVQVVVSAREASGGQTRQAFELRVLPDHWRAGDLHVHTTYSTDGTRGNRVQYRERARTVWTRKTHGLDWITFSDHTDATQGDYPSWDEALALTTPEFVAIPGAEISNRFDGHFNGIPRDLQTFDHSGDYRTRWEDPGATNQEQLDEVHRRGGWAIVNHPFGPLWITYDLSSDDYDAIEIWNGGAHNDDWDSQAIEWWLDQLGAGRRIVGVGGSDCHRYDEADAPKLAEPATFVWTPHLDFASLTSALFAGRVVVADHDNFLDLRASAGWSGAGQMVGGELVLRPGEPVRFSMVGHVRYGSDVKLWALKPGQKGSQKRLVRSVHTPNGFVGRSSFEVYTTEVPDGDTIYYAETHHLALPLDNEDYVRTNALFVQVR